MTAKRTAPTDEALGLPSLEEIEPRPAEPGDPTDSDYDAVRRLGMFGPEIESGEIDVGAALSA